MRRAVSIFLLLLALSITAGAAGAQQTATPAAAKPAPSKPGLDGFNSFVEETLKDWKVPGVAVAVVHDGKVIHSKGHGLRDVKKSLPVTPKTLLAIGSITKSFTVTALGILVDDGKLDWDKPVREYLPAFRLHDPVATERMTPRDLVTHRSGLPRHDLIWYNSSFTRKEMFDRLRYLEPSKDFRSTFQYNNLMFMTAGYLAGQLSGGTWEQFVRQKILIPLGMESSNFSVSESQKRADFALPYRKVKEEIVEVPFRNIDEIGPAGSINSNVEDMGRYVLLHLNKGKHGPTQIVSEKNVLDMQAPQMVTPGPLRFSEVGHSSYGMGWMISTYRGHKMVQHGGGIDGFTALVSFMPQDKIGMVILTNLSGTPLPTILSYNVYDRLLGLDQIAWSRRMKDQEKKQSESADEAKKKGLTIRRSGTAPSHDLKEYAGEYEHPGYGVARIALENNELKITFNRITAPLKHFHYDYFEVPEDPLIALEKTKVNFITNVKGEISAVSIPLEPSVKEIVFTRMPEKEMLEKGFLEALAGEYALAGATASVALRADRTLTLTVPGQPVYELAPTRGLSFDIKGLTGFSIEFKKDATGAVTEMVSHQPNGSFAAKRK